MRFYADIYIYITRMKLRANEEILCGYCYLSEFLNDNFHTDFSILAGLSGNPLTRYHVYSCHYAYILIFSSYTMFMDLCLIISSFIDIL